MSALSFGLGRRAPGLRPLGRGGLWSMDYLLSTMGWAMIQRLTAV